MRYFITFKKDTTHYGKTLVIEADHRQIAWDLALKHYGCEIIDTMWTEQEYAQLLPKAYSCTENWISFGTEVSTTGQNVSLEPITKWFKTAKPEPIVGFPDKWVATQIGAHLEEIGELLEVYSKNAENTDLQNQAVKAFIEVKALSQMFYKLEKLPVLSKEEHIAVLDSLADQIVTGTGVAYFSKYDFDDALTEVNKSNFSKFENGKPVLNEHGKIMKGKDYFKPNLTNFVK